MNIIIDKPFQPDRVIAALSVYLRPAAPGPTDSGS